MKKAKKSLTAPSNWNGLERAHQEIRDLKQTVLINTPGKITRKILCLSDLHIPFHMPDVINTILDQHQDADICVLNGDILDCYAVSTFVRDKKVALYSEYQMALRLLQRLSSMFKAVYMVKGNHEFRVNRWFSTHVSEELNWMINKEVLARLASGEEYDETGEIIETHSFPNVFFVGGEEPWWFTLGDCAFVHPLSYSSVKMQTAVKAAQRLDENRVNFNCLVMAHTHQVGEVIWKGKKLIEQGALCHKLDYEKQGKLSYNPHALGYGLIYQDASGITDMSSSRVVYLGTVVENKILERKM